MCGKLRSIDTVNASNASVAIYYTFITGRSITVLLSSETESSCLLCYIIHVRPVQSYSHIVVGPRPFTYSQTNVPYYKGGRRNSLQELEKNATATPNTATLLTTLAFSGEVRVL